jgi:hypothetical protein
MTDWHDRLDADDLDVIEGPDEVSVYDDHGHLTTLSVETWEAMAEKYENPRIGLITIINDEINA